MKISLTDCHLECLLLLYHDLLDEQEECEY